MRHYITTISLTVILGALVVAQTHPDFNGVNNHRAKLFGLCENPVTDADIMACDYLRFGEEGMTSNWN